MTWKYRIDYEQSIEIIEEQLRHEPKMDWNEGDPRPPWKPDRDKRYRQKMTDWVNWHLDHAPTPDFTPSTPDEAKRQWELLKNDGLEIAAAERGDIEPLRKKWPHLAKYLHLAKRERGKRFASLPWCESDPAKFAAIEVKEIAALWQKYYGKKVRRRRFEPSAAEIAAGDGTSR